MTLGFVAQILAISIADPIQSKYFGHGAISCLSLIEYNNAHIPCKSPGAAPLTDPLTEAQTGVFHHSLQNSQGSFFVIEAKK